MKLLESSVTGKGKILELYEIVPEREYRVRIQGQKVDAGFDNIDDAIFYYQLVTI